MGKIEISVTPYPKTEITAICHDCGKVIKREIWDSYADYKRKMAKFKQIKTCHFCAKAVMQKEEPEAVIKWERTAKGDYQARVLNGDFLVFKWGNGLMRWRWRFRKTGEASPDRICVAKTKEEAMKECEQHEEWRLV